RSDLFSLVAVLYQLLTGQRAFEAGTRPAVLLRVMNDDPQPPSQVVPALPLELDAVVAKALAKDRGDRYRSGLELAQDLEALLEGRAPLHAGVASSSAGSGSPSGTGPPGLATTRLSDMLSAAAGTSVLQGRPPGPGRRRRLMLGSLVGAAALATVGFTFVLMLLRGTTGPQASILPLPIPLPTLISAPGRLEIYLEHSVRAGRLKVSVDDAVVLEQAIEGKLVKKVLNFRQYKGTLRQALDVRPGERVIRVEV